MHVNRGRHVSVSVERGLIPTFEEFKMQHGRTYQLGSSEHATRQALFEKHVAAVHKLNARPGRTWTAVVNRLADRTYDELQALRGWDRSVHPERSAVRPATQQALHTKHLDSGKTAPTCVSWTHLPSILSVLDQASCGSCWAFAAAKALEAGTEIFQTRRTFSTEQIVSCTANPRQCGGSGGCSGATSELAFEYVLGTGCETEETIPYHAGESRCVSHRYKDKGPHSLMSRLQDGTQLYQAGSSFGNSTFSASSFGMIGWAKLPENKLLPLKLALVQYGPIAVSVSATDAFSFYGSGILTQSDCPKDAIVNHAVTLVGYGESSGTRYWHILNSWGESWGEQGFVRIGMSSDEEKYCGTDVEPQKGTACKGETEPVRVCGTCGILYDASVPLFRGSGEAARQRALPC